MARFVGTLGKSKDATVAALGPPTRTISVNDSGSGPPWNRQQHFLTYEYEVDGRKQRVYFGDDGRVVGLWMPLAYGSLDGAAMYDGPSFGSTWAAAGGGATEPSIVSEIVDRTNQPSNRAPTVLNTAVQGRRSDGRRVMLVGKCREPFRAANTRHFDTASNAWVEKLERNPRFAWGACTAYHVVVASDDRELKFLDDYNYNTFFDPTTGNDIEATRANVTVATAQDRLHRIAQDFHDQAEVLCSPAPFAPERAQPLTKPFSLDKAVSGPGQEARGNTRYFQCRVTVRLSEPADADVSIPVTWGYYVGAISTASFAVSAHVAKGATETTIDLPGSIGVNQPQIVRLWARVDATGRTFVDANLTLVW
ncbi:MAG: hypothetical protein JO093_01140 [Acidobacteria bacterium]|nr:hypothetical protein [Acidobacteriota bacterium]MBV9069017.1 hypothetical protein [Acidobacteriota bacterium]MBV9184187.1 hypothetical protein [Acidobacteriota bacterium]